MKLLDVFAFAESTLRKHRRRTGLSLLGVSIGVASVLLLTSLGEGARGYVDNQFQTLGTNLLGVMPGKVETTGGIPGFGGVPNDLTLRDAQAIARRLPGVLHVVPIVMGNDTLSYGERSRQVAVAGVTAGARETHKFSVRGGSFLPDSDWDRGASVAVIGSKLGHELFPGVSPLGKAVRVGSHRMRVIGVLEPRGLHFGMNWDEVVFVPVATAMRMFDKSSLFRIAVQMRPSADLEVAKRRVVDLLVERHGEEDVTVTTPDAIVGALTSILTVLTLALAGIAAISLTVAGIGIMNVMLVSVSERTREIGLLKAVGAAPGQILAVFLAEAVMISATGGALGLALGLALVRAVVALYPAFPAEAPAWALGGALVVSLVVGVVFGILPARNAVRLDPVVALAKG